MGFTRKKKIKNKNSKSFRKNKKQTLRRNSRKTLKRKNLRHKNQRKRTLKGGAALAARDARAHAKVNIKTTIYQNSETPNSLVGKFKAFCKTNKSLPDFRKYACQLIAKETSVDDEPPDVQSTINSMVKNWNIFTMFEQGGWYSAFLDATGLDPIGDKGLRDLINVISDRDQCKIVFDQLVKLSNCDLQ